MWGLHMRFSKVRCLILLSVIIITIVAVFQMALTGRALELTVDKTSYEPWEDITVTLTNRSNKTLLFGHLRYCLFFERWEDGAWTTYIPDVGGQDATARLEPGETARITLTSCQLLPGRYRIGSRFTDELAEKGCIAYSQEFIVV